MKHFPIPIEDNVPLQIATLFGGDMILVGGDQGVTSVFHCNSGERIGTLNHGREGKTYSIPHYSLSLTNTQIIVQMEAGPKLWVYTVITCIPVRS